MAPRKVTKNAARKPARKPAFKETDLYPPLKKYLEKNGYTVRSEVKHCDVVACKGDDLIVIEMKRSFNLELLIQASRRQGLTASVYVAIPRPADMSRRSRWPDITRLLRQLSLGLIYISLDGPAESVEVAFHPIPYERKRTKKARRAVLREVEARSDDYNLGGSSGKTLMTAYRENAIQIACYLDRLGPSSPKKLRVLGTGKKTQSILSSNFYEWFERVDRGIYNLTKQGKKALKLTPELTRVYRRRFKTQSRLLDRGQA
jgi:hypothetical protein